MSTTTTGKERQREFTYPEGMTSVVEFASLIGASYATANAWAKKNYIPIHRPSPRKMCVRYEEAIKAPIVVEFLQKNGKAPPPIDLEEAVVIPRVPARPEPTEPLYVEPAPERETFTVIVPTAKPAPIATPEPLVEKEEALFLHARQAAQPYIKQARDCAARGEKQAERVLLWLALESLGFGARPN